MPLGFSVAFWNGMVTCLQGTGGTDAHVKHGVTETFKEANLFMRQAAEGTDGAFPHEGDFRV